MHLKQVSCAACSASAAGTVQERFAIARPAVIGDLLQAMAEALQ